jgi:acetyl esterase
LKWAVDHAEALRIDPERLAVGGDSAGGNLAAVIALMARDGTLPAVGYQLLFYPAVDLAPIDPGFERTTPGVPLTGAGMRYFIDHYLPDPQDRLDWRASPLRAPSLEGVAPAFVLTCGHDPLCEEGRLYAARLEREGVAVTALHLSDQTHGILNMAKLIGAASGVIGFAADALRQAWR